MKSDICVYGGTAAGVVAAVAAAKEGRSVILVNPVRHLGGMTSGGLGATDIGDKKAVGGMARDFYRFIGNAYGVEEQWTFEPKVAEQVLSNLVLAYPVKIFSGERVKQIIKKGRRILGLITEKGTHIEPSMVIDAGYEGDVMALAGVSYTVGRESTAQYEESLSGIRGETPIHQFELDVDPYVKSGRPDSGLIPCIQPGDGGIPGEGDKRVQAYNFRLCLTQDKSNFLDIASPHHYDPWRYELLARYLEAGYAGGTPQFKDFFRIIPMPHGKTDFNNYGGFSTDHIGANWQYPDANYLQREAIWQDHMDYTRGFFHFLQSDQRVPPSLREEAQSWGLCKDEFQDTQGWPHQLYVRETRRMVGLYVMTQADCQKTREAKDFIAMGAYNMDSHNCQRIVQDGFVRNEGDVQVQVEPYGISYRTVIPKEEECENLLVPVCLSASHIAYGSIRMEPVFMILGQSCALAACQALEQKKIIQGIDIAKLRKILIQAGQIIE